MKSPSPEQIIRKLTSKRYVAPVLAGLIILGAIVGYLANLSGNLRKLKSFTSAEDRRTKKKAAFDLGLATAQMSGYKLIDVGSLDSTKKEDVENWISQQLAEIGSLLTVLGIKLDAKALDYRCRPGLFENSPANNLLAKKIADLHRDDMEDLFHFGMKLKSAELKAQLKEYGRSGEDSGFDAYIDVNALNVRLTRQGVAALKLNDIDDVSLQTKESFNDALFLKISDAIHAVDNRLR